MTSAADNQSHAEDVVIARVVKARGIRGEVACDLETDFPDRFESLEQATLWMPDGSRLKLTVEDYWFHNGRVILKFGGYDTMTAAEELVGGRIVIAEADARKLDDDEFYEYDLIGLEVVTADERDVGRVVRLMRAGGTSLLVIEGQDNDERLIPFVDDICTEVDVKAGRITINPPEGLLDL